jgi:hypothetical protein
MAQGLPESSGAGHLISCVLWLALLLCGCTTIDYRAGPVAGLENMAVEEHFVDYGELYSACARCGHNSLVVPLACTCIDFTKNRAVVWLSRGAPPPIIEHERAHALGYDHTDGELRSRYATWKSTLAKKAARPPEATYQAKGEVGKAINTRTSDLSIRRSD